MIEIKCNEDTFNQKWMWGRVIALNTREGWVDVAYSFSNEPTVVKARLFVCTISHRRCTHIFFLLPYES